MTKHQYLFTMFLWIFWGSLVWILSLIFPSPLLQYGTEIIETLIYFVIIYVAVQISRCHLLKKRISAINKAVLITGCDSGFGQNLAKRLDERGFIVYATCLFPLGGAISLRSTCSRRVHVIGMDVTKDESVEQALKYVKEHLKNTEFWAVVNNAGIVHVSEVEWAGLDTFKNSLEVNTLGVVRVTKAFLPLLRQFKGRVVTVTSLAGRISVPSLSAYCMSKFAAVSFCQTLRQEMYPWGVKIISIEPEIFRTPITDITHIHQTMDDAWGSSPEEVRTAYGQNYNEGYKASVKKSIEMASPKIHKVVECMENAVMATEPCSRYRPYRHLLMNIIFWIYEHLPQPLCDLFLRIFQKIMKFPIPTGVKK